MTDHLAYVRPGVSADGLVNSAERYNLLTDAARMARTSRDGFRAENAPVPLGENEIRVKNDTGADRERFDIVAFEDPVYLRGDNLYAFSDRQQNLLSAIEPAWPDHFLSWGVLQEPCRAGKIARVRVGGVAVALVNFANSAAQTWHKHATIIDATYGRLESTFAGSARILWRDTTAVDSTLYWCKLWLNSPFDSELFGVLDGSLSQGGSATMSVHRHDGSSWSDTTANVTVYDRLLKSGATAISSGKWVVARFYSGRWWVVSAECN